MSKIRQRLVKLFFHYCQNQKYALLVPYKESSLPSLHVESDFKKQLLVSRKNRELGILAN